MVGNDVIGETRPPPPHMLLYQILWL